MIYEYKNPLLKGYKFDSRIKRVIDIDNKVMPYSLYYILYDKKYKHKELYDIYKKEIENTFVLVISFKNRYARYFSSCNTLGEIKKQILLDLNRVDDSDFFKEFNLIEYNDIDNVYSIY